MESNALLVLDSVSKHFGALRAVDEVSLQIQKEEIVGLIGPNGSGKTTLINLITGMLPKTKGRVFFKRIDITNLPPYKIAKLGIARTFQIVTPLAGMTAEENVMTGALFGRRKCRSVKEARRIAWDCMELVGIFEKRSLPVADLTLIDSKLLEFARALSMDPDLLLLDELMAGLRPAEIVRVLETIKRINTEWKKTILFVEHVMKAVMSISNRVIVLNAGKKIADGPPEAIVKNPQVIQVYLGNKYREAAKDE